MLVLDSFPQVMLSLLHPEICAVATALPGANALPELAVTGISTT